MPKIGGRSRLVSIGGVVLAGLAGVVGVVLLATPAGAHTATLEASSSCDQTSGTYTITYTGHSHDTDLGGTAAVTSSAPDGAGVSVSPMSQTITAAAPFTITQTGIPGTATTASMSVRVVWTDSYQQTASTQVALGGNCAGTPPTTPGTPTFVDDTCSTTDSAGYTIPDTAYVDYLVNGTKVDAGTHEATDGDTITITAVAQPGHTLTGTTTWTHTYPAAPTDCEGPAAPSFTDDVCAATAPAGASYTIPDTDGVDYLVDGTKATAGTHEAKDSTTITITAVASDGHELNGTTTWTHTYPAAPTDCGASGAAPAPKFTDATCESPSATYTIPSSTNVKYMVNGVQAAAGAHSASAGTSVTITAVANSGFTIVGTKTWTHSFASTAIQCVAGGGAPVSGPTSGTPAGGSDSAALANTGPDYPVGQATIIGMLLALLGGVCLWVGRRPAAPGRHSVAKV